MLNIDEVKTVYLACGVTDLRKSIDGLTMIIENQFNLDTHLIKLYLYFVISK